MDDRHVTPNRWEVSDPPRYRYDCEQCRFVWTCGPLCACVLRNQPDPPPDRQREVNAARAAAGLDPEFTPYAIT